jgi:hypothetical protein
MCRLTSDALLASSKPSAAARYRAGVVRDLKASTFVALKITARFLRSPAALIPSQINPHIDRPTNHSAIASHLERPNYQQ